MGDAIMAPYGGNEDILGEKKVLPQPKKCPRLVYRIIGGITLLATTKEGWLGDLGKGSTAGRPLPMMAQSVCFP